MENLRKYLIATVTWFFILYNIERLSAPMNIASFVYFFVAASAVLILALPGLQRLSMLALFGLAFLPFWVLKVTLGYEIMGTNLPITITEIVIISITLVLARLIGRDLSKLQEEIANLTISHLQVNTRGFEIYQSQIYREIRRARRYHRPATLLAISPQEKSIQLSLHKIVEEAKNSITRKYIAMRIAKILSEGLKDMDVITQRNDHFVILLPETNRENALTVISRIEATIQQELGLGLNVGYSSFPEEAVTFAHLLEAAEAKMRSAGAQHQPGENAEVEMPTATILPAEQAPGR